MRILFLTQTYPRFAGDTSGPFIRELARGLVAGGDEVTVLAPHSRDVPRQWSDSGVATHTFRYAPAGFEVLGYGRSLSKDESVRWRAAAVAPWYWLAARWALRSFVRQSRFDLVHAHWIVPNGIIASGARLGVPLAIGLHGSDVFLAEKGGLRGLARRALARTAVLTGCSPELVERVCEVGFDRSRSYVIPYGVDVDQFSPATEDRSQWRQRLEIPATAIVVLGVGRMVTKKGFHLLLDEIPALLTAHPDVYFVLAGGGDRLEEFRTRSARHTERVRFTGEVFRDTLPDLYRSADVFVLPAVHDAQGNVDGLPNVILEAMASGLPIVATGISGIPLAVTDGVEGLLVKEQDTQALARALESLIGDRQQRQRMGRAARQKAATSLTWSTIASQYRAAYAAALEPAAAGTKVEAGRG